MVVDEHGKARLTLIFDDEAEKARFEAICPSAELSEHWVIAGTEQCEKTVVDSILAGRLGETEAAIDRNITIIGKSGERELRKGKDRVSPDLVLCYRIGFRSRARLAKEEFLAALAVLEKATDAMEKLTAGFTAAAEAMDLAARMLPAAIAGPPPVGLPLAPPARRRLRPEDFGALPSVPRA